MTFIENENTELKRELTKEIKKEIIAFANSGGGTIYIGIDDNGKIVGVKDVKSDVETLSGMIREGIKSDLTLYTKIVMEKIDDKDIIAIKVMDAPNKPYYLAEKGLKSTGVYLRYGNTSIPASEENIKKMIFDTQNQSFENMISINQDLHFDYMNNIFKSHNIILDNNKYKTLNIINLNGKYTNLGLLLSDENPYTIKCAIFNGNNKMEFRDRKEFTGSVLKQAKETFEYINLYNKTKGKIVGLERIDTNDYPGYALREALLNAIIHRDYNYAGSILVSLFDDHFEITSLGGLIKGLSINDLYLGVSETRNPNLANVFYRLKYVESFGTGIERIFESYKEYDKKPVLKNAENLFKVILYNVNYNETKKENITVNLSQKELIIQYLKKNGTVNRATIEQLLDISKSRTKEILNEMILEGTIKIGGSGRTTYYELK